MGFDEATIERFWSKVDKSGGPDACWMWNGSRYPRGYGYMFINGFRLRATHIALEISGNPRVQTLVAMHSCDTPRCVNPSHLKWATQKENMLDCVAKKRNNGPLSLKYSPTCRRGHEYSIVGKFSDGGGRYKCKACFYLRIDTYRARAKALES